MFTLLDFKDIMIRKFEFVAKTQFLSLKNTILKNLITQH